MFWHSVSPPPAKAKNVIRNRVIEQLLHVYGIFSPAFSCHMNCSQSHGAAKLQFSSSSRSRQIHQQPQSCPEFPPKFSKSSLNWSCSQTCSSLQRKNFHSLSNFSIFSNFPAWYCLFSNTTRIVSDRVSLRNTCCISCSFLFSSTSLMRFSLKNCFKTVNTDDRS